MIASSDLRRTFGDLRVVHVASIEPDGAPHVVPLWFVWLQDAVFVTCREGSRVCRNLRRDPRTALEFERGRDWTEQAGALIRGRAEFLPEDHTSTRRAISAWFEKYRELLSGRAFAAYTDQVERPLLVRVRPERIAVWDHAVPRSG